MSEKPVAEFPVEPDEQPTLAGVSPAVERMAYVLRQPGNCRKCGGGGYLLRAYLYPTGDERGTGSLEWRLEGCPDCGGTGGRS